MKNGQNVEISAGSLHVVMIKSVKNVRLHVREDVNVNKVMFEIIMENVSRKKCVHLVPDVKAMNTGITVEVLVMNQIVNIHLDTAKINVAQRQQCAHQDVNAKLDS